MDADLVADLHLEQVAPFVQALGQAFYADVGMMRDAIHQHGSCNLIHLDTMFNLARFGGRTCV